MHNLISNYVIQDQRDGFRRIQFSGHRDEAVTFPIQELGVAAHDGQRPYPFTEERFADAFPNGVHIANDGVPPHERQFLSERCPRVERFAPAHCHIRTAHCRR